MRAPLRRRTTRTVLVTFVLVGLASAISSAQASKRRAEQRARKSAPAAATAPGPATPKSEMPVPFRVGEQLTYDVSWSSYLTAGEATLAVREKKPSYGSTAYYIVGEGKPTGLVASLYTLYYKADTLLDAYTLLPQRGSVFSQEGKRRRLKVTRFDHPAHSAEYEVQTASTVKQSVKLPASVQDALSAVYVLRAIRLQEGDRFAMPVCDGGSNFRVMFQVGKREPVKTGAGTIPAFRVTASFSDAKRKPVGRPLTVWISEDARKLPLRLETSLAVGSVNLTLRDAR
jgi:hypothetical protein